ncbi:MAG: alpha/beta hydrolase [Roseiflexaceae bacterium]|nr:alpha/beta hydrolase [Roseiflexaceae bacterium]
MAQQPSLIDQPSEHFCETSSLSYLAAGERGPTLVLLHGWGAFKELWWSAMLQLAGNYRVFAPDMPGHGGSAVGQTHTMRQIAERIAMFCAARGADQIALVGHSMGGNVAVELALAHPTLVRRLALVDAAAAGPELPLYIHSYLNDVFGYAALRLTLLFNRQVARYGPKIPHDHGGGMLLPGIRRLAYTANYDAGEMRLLLRSLLTNPIEARAGSIAVPTLVISGAHDPLVPAAFSRRLAAAIPGARYLEIAGAAHNPMDERPREFAAALEQFLKGDT